MESYVSIIMIVVLFVVLYFFMIRPQKKQEKKDAAMRDALAVGDEVTTIGGIIGKVVSIKGETFVLETTKDKTKIRFLKGAIRTVDVKAADIAAAISLLICSVFSLPVSTTHAKTTSIMGVGAVRRISAINFSVVKEMAVTWILTFPGCGLIGFIMTKIFMAIF